MAMTDQIRMKIEEALSPTHIEVVDESHMHNVPQGAESHFNLFVVSEGFQGRRLVQRHQTVYRALADEMAGSVHALALKTLTPEEWAEQGGGAATSPQCLGGSKADR
ncbi:MAG: BolA family transcriptional regulator [Deltaproteobacteria bacterium]|nr:BolA family transcriptional regulator [Deltaproteobacteria bacterium]